MKSFFICTLLLCAASSVSAQRTDSARTQPTQVAVATSQASAAGRDTNAEAYVSAALALCQSAKETSDTTVYSQAEDAINHALAIAPGNFDAEKVRVSIALGRREFASARELAKALNRRVPDDVSVYGMLADADLALGDYHEAEQATQWMLKLRVGNVPALVRTAQLREVFGDLEGAIQVLQMVLDSSGPADVENRAWALTQIARIDLGARKIGPAEGAIYQALALAPDSPDTLATMARLRIAQNRGGEAVEYLRRAYQSSGQLETMYALAEAMQAAGLRQDSARAFADFEREALARSTNAINSNRELVLYYVDHAHKPAEAIRIAELEIARRHDVFTLDAYAWALFNNQQYGQARKQIEAALNPGIREATMLRHASQIAVKLNDPAAAERYQKMAAESDLGQLTAVSKSTQIAIR